MEDKTRDSYRIFSENDAAEIRRLCGSLHSADIASKLAEMSGRDICAVLTRINPHKAAQIFNYFSDALQLRVAGIMPDQELAAIIDFLGSDEQADILKRLEKRRQNRILKLLPEQDSISASALAAYPEGTAGAVMTRSFIMLELDSTAAAARKTVAEFEDIDNLHYIYVNDAQGRVCGSLRLIRLLGVADNIPLREICELEIISVPVWEDQEKAARKLERYDLLSLSVVDEEGKLLGIITYDDAFEVIIKEQTEDMQKMMAMSSSDIDNGESYLNISAFQHFRKRISWIVGLALLGLVSGYVLHTFEDVLSGLVILALYMPMLADTGGNTGSQSSTLIIRALALGELKPGDILRVMFKEFRVSLMISVILMVLAYGKIALLSGGSTMPEGFTLSQIGMAISLALGIQVVSSTIIGAVLPLGVSSLNLDPAVIASPAITSIVDITGLLIYFYTVSAMLGLN